MEEDGEKETERCGGVPQPELPNDDSQLNMAAHTGRLIC